MAAGIEDDRHRLERLEAKRTRLDLDLDDARRRDGRRGRGGARPRRRPRQPRWPAAPTPRPGWPRPRPSCRRPRPSATAGRPGPRRWPWPSTRPGPAPAPSGSPAWTAWSARCSTWSRSTPGCEAAFEAAVGEALAAVVVDVGRRRSDGARGAPTGRRRRRRAAARPVARRGRVRCRDPAAAARPRPGVPARPSRSCSTR